MLKGKNFIMKNNNKKLAFLLVTVTAAFAAVSCGRKCVKRPQCNDSHMEYKRIPQLLR